MTDKELLQQALDTLDTFSDENGWGEKQKKAYEAIKARLAQPDAEAVAWVDEITLRDLKNGKEGVHLVYEVEMVNASIPLFEYPPEKEWVGLTDKEVVILAYQSQENECTAIRLAEQALKEKNT